MIGWGRCSQTVWRRRHEQPTPRLYSTAASSALNAAASYIMLLPDNQPEYGGALAWDGQTFASFELAVTIVFIAHRLG